MTCNPEARRCDPHHEWAAVECQDGKLRIHCLRCGYQPPDKPQDELDQRRNGASGQEAFCMTVLDRIAEILARARIAGGWVDEDVAVAVLKELGLDHNGEPLDLPPTSSNLGHG